VWKNCGQIVLAEFREDDAMSEGDDRAQLLAALRGRDEVKFADAERMMSHIAALHLISVQHEDEEVRNAATDRLAVLEHASQ
jgi:hypothetical protein